MGGKEDAHRLGDLVCIIIVAVFWVAMIGIYGLQIVMMKAEYRDYIQENPIIYSRGKFFGKVYANYWADLEYRLPKGLHFGDETELDSETVDGWLIVLQNGNDRVISVCCEKLPASMDVSEQKYLEIVRQKEFFTFQEQVRTKEIAGNTYYVMDTLPDGYGRVMTCYNRKGGPYRMIVIMIYGSSPEENDKMAENFKDL